MVSEAAGVKAISSTLSVSRGLFYVCFAAIAWGTGGAVAAILYSNGLGPVAVSFWRFAIGMLVLALVALIMNSKEKRRAMGAFIRERWRRMMVIGMGLAIYQTAYFAAVQYSGLAVATIVTLGLGPVLMAIGSYLTMNERISRTGALIMAFAILGLGLLTWGGEIGSHSLLGLAFAVLSSICYACVTLITRAMGRHAYIDRFNVTFFGIVIGTLCLLPFALFEGLTSRSGTIFQSVVFLSYLGVVPTAAAYILFNAGLSSVRATTASVMVLIEPVTAALIAVLFLGETLTPIAVFGVTILMASVVILAFSERHGALVVAKQKVS
ncbi:DMT family transporter [Marinomonas spartinae]|uniref:DMT family transporter n=1 Tax=Marinomonas spartinae TaxID=1792290 RepID=UPI0018F1DBC4|nr:EamA family transporter [Marinomonas spartinae]MBJ7554568.1 EamA family transporter [Marinomonas spartinae]